MSKKATKRLSKLIVPFHRPIREGICIVLCLTFAQAALGQPRAPGAFPIHIFWNATSTNDLNGNVVSLTLNLVTDETVESFDFGTFLTLETFSINSSYVTNRSLVHLRKLPPGLSHLRMLNTQVDDKELVPLLRRLKSLRWLNLEGIEISDRILSEMKGLPELTFLGLTRTKFDNVNLNRLTELEGLRHLDLSETGLTDRGLQEIGKLKGLYSLRLGGTKITDVGLRNLAGIEELFRLDVPNTKVTDEGILSLQGLDNLQKLNVSNTKVTEKGKAALKALLPDLEFVTEVPLNLQWLEDIKFGK